eukprot:TRINITY_DN248_c0_g2_i1.p1 TRINITY_DN248_c0_g2~~TRINITY_DN248_c0_g2_i1.p1  ORF type:complete len:1019 (+),score=213.90 TRINITY_DN248_c0_g2_i1:211-3267(+)
MEDLISLSETISQASTLLADGVPGEDGTTHSSFLQVMVIGSMGCGKSGVLNSLIGSPVLPTAEGGATRFPLTIDLERNAHIRDDGVRGKMGTNQNMQSAAEICKVVLADMKKWVSARGQDQQQRQLIVQSAGAPPLRLMDIPGLEARASESDNEVFDRAGGDTILLVVVTAASLKDGSATRILKMVQDLDQEGHRTVGVVTKLDEVAEDRATVTAVVDILTGQGPSMAQEYPWVAVIGQPPSDPALVGDARSDSLEDAWRLEAKALPSILRAQGAKGLEPCLGREGLVRTLARQIRKRMKERIPRIMDGLESRSQEVEDELLRLGDTVMSTQEGSRAVALELCRGFDTKFVENIEGGEAGGAKMVEKFVGALPGRFRALSLDKLFNVENVKQVTREADGYQPYLTSPEKGLQLLVKRSLDLAKQPGLQCVDEVHKILLDVVSAASNSAPSLVRFPPLKNEMIAIATSALDSFRAEARIMVSSLVDMERVFIPPGHFIDAAYRRYEKQKLADEAARKAAQDKLGRRSGSTSSADSAAPPEQGRLSAAIGAIRGTKKEPPAPPPAPVKELAGYLWKVSSKNDWSKRWFALSDKTARLYYVKQPNEKTPRGVIPLEECVIEDVVPAEEYPVITAVASSDPLRASSALPDNPASLVFKISNKVPYKTVVKVHNNLILRTDTLAEKQQWVARLRALTGKGGAEEETKAEPQAAEAAPPPDVAPAPKDRQRDGAAPPPPDKPLKRVPMDPEEELKYMSLEVRTYVDVVLSQLSANVPKAIVLTQVERAKDSMLTRLYTSISKLPNERIAELLTEDLASKGSREKAQKQQKALVSLKRMLSLHEARASAEEANAAPEKKDNPLVEDWRAAFQSAGGGRTNASQDDDEGSTAKPSRRKPPPPAPPSAPAPSSSSSGPSRNVSSASSDSGSVVRPSRDAPQPPNLTKTSSGGLLNALANLTGGGGSGATAASARNPSPLRAPPASSGANGANDPLGPPPARGPPMVASRRLPTPPSSVSLPFQNNPR